MDLEGITIHPHPHIPHDQFHLLFKIHNAIDSILSLHYSAHSQLITAHQLFSKVSHLLKRNTTNDQFLSILMIEPRCYKLIDPVGVKDASPYKVGLFVPINTFNSSLTLRRLRFINAINEWIIHHNHLTTIPIPCIDDIILDHRSVANSGGDSDNSNWQNGSNSTSPSSKLTRLKVSKAKPTLKNDSSKFMFKPKDEKTQQSNHNGLSLLERIKLKEARTKLEAEIETPEIKRNKYLESKLPQIYNILAQINGENNDKMKSYPLKKLTQLIKDSLNYPIHNEEIHDCLKIIQSKLSQQALVVTTRKDLSVVKVYKLDRTNDLKLLT